MKLLNVAACFLALSLSAAALADPVRFDLAGPNLEVRVTRGNVTLPIAQVPNLQPGDKLWVKAALPSSQSNHLLLIVAFLRGTTNEPPDNWFTEIQTWDKKTAEGTTITVPAEAQQAVMFIAPETSGDFKTLRSAVKGRPGLFIRADADLNEASFQQQRIQHYLAAMKEVADSDEKTIEDHSAKLAATLALKPNADCFKQPVDQQVNCLTISSAPVLLDDGHGQSVAEALSSGASSDFINAASLTQPAGGGVYSAYVGAVVDLVHLVSLLGTAQYQYIPGLAFPNGDTLNLKLNAPVSFHNPKSVIVIGLPAIQKPKLPPLHVHDVNQVACLLQPKMPLPLEGAPLVFATSFAHDLVLHLNRTGNPTDLPLEPDAFNGGLIVVKEQQRKPLPFAGSAPATHAKAATKIGSASDVDITATVRGYWGFDYFEGPVVAVQQVDGKTWKVSGDPQLMAGKDNHVTLVGDGTACVQHIVLTRGKEKDIDVAFKPATEETLKAAKDDDAKAGEAAKPVAESKEADNKKDAKPAKDDKKGDDDKKPAAAKPAAPPAKQIRNTLALDVSLTKVEPGGYALGIRQYGESSEDKVPLTAYNAEISFATLKMHSGDETAELTGKGLQDVVSVELDGKTLKPVAAGSDDKTLNLHADTALTPKDGAEAKVKLKDGRTLPVKVKAESARPGLTLVSFHAVPNPKQGTLAVVPGGKDDIELNGKLTFVVQTKNPFPRSQTIEVATADGAVHTALSIAANTLILQDEHTAVATLDPLKAFGQSAFGKLQMRPVAQDGTAGDWTALGTLVRVPQISAINCSTDAQPQCKAEGSNLFLVQAFSAAKDFSNPAPVPTGFSDSTLPVPIPADGATLYLKLRDDPNSLATVTLPTPLQKPAPAANSSGPSASGPQQADPTKAPAATPATAAQPKPPAI